MALESGRQIPTQVFVNFRRSADSNRRSPLKGIWNILWVLWTELSMSLNRAILCDERGHQRQIEVGDLRSFLLRSDIHWEQGSGDCSLVRARDGSQISFVVRPRLGVMLVYDPPRSHQLVYCPPSAGDRGDLVPFSLGGDEICVPRSWFIPLFPEGFRILQDFLMGAAIEEGLNWREYLVNTSF